MTAASPEISYNEGVLTYIGTGTGSISWTINGTEAGTTGTLDVSGLTQNSVIELSVDSSLVATAKVVTASDFGDGEVVLAQHTADYLIWNGTGAAPARAGISGVETAVLQAAETQGAPEAFEVSDATGTLGTLYSAQDGFFQLDQGNQAVYLAGFSAVLVGTKALELSTNYINADSAGNFDVIGTPFSGDVLDVLVTAVPTGSAVDSTDSNQVNFTDGSSNVVAYYTTTLDQTDIDEWFTGKVVAINGDETTTTYYVQGIESLAFDTLTPSNAPFSYDLPGGGTTQPPGDDPNAPDYTTADDTTHAGYVGDGTDNYAVISNGVSGNYSIDGDGGFDVVEVKDQLFLGDNRIIESETAADTYLVQSRINGDFVTISSIVRAGNADVVLTKEAITSINQLAATVTLVSVEALALVEPPAHEGGTPTTELVPLVWLEEVDPYDGYVTIDGSIFSDQIAIDASLGPFFGEVFGNGGSDRVTVNLGNLAPDGAVFTLVRPPSIDGYSEFTYSYDAGTPGDQTDDLTINVEIYPASPGSDQDTRALVEVTTSNAPEIDGYVAPDAFSVSFSGVDQLEIGGLELDLKLMSDIAERGSAKFNDYNDRVVTKLDDPRANWRDSVTREVAEGDLRIDASNAPAGKVLIGFDDDFTIDIGGELTRLTEELRGGSFDDVLIGRGGHNRLDGGDGYDTVDYSFAAEAVRVSLFDVGEQFTGVSNDTVVRVENIIGSGDSDILGGNGRQNGVDGGMGNDFIDGGRGNDHLFGGDGNDHIMGGVGNDVIEGGFGNDTLSGGIGRDTFVFHHPEGMSWTYMSSDLQGSDVITDFNPYADKILISINGGGFDFATAFAETAVAVDAGADATPMAQVIDDNLSFVMNNETNVGSLMLSVGDGSTAQIEVTSFQAGLDLTNFAVSSYVNVDVLSYNAAQIA